MRAAATKAQAKGVERNSLWPQAQPNSGFVQMKLVLQRGTIHSCETLNCPYHYYYYYYYYYHV
jgi:hypothetical protein